MWDDVEWEWIGAGFGWKWVDSGLAGGSGMCGFGCVRRSGAGASRFRTAREADGDTGDAAAARAGG